MISAVLALMLVLAFELLRLIAFAITFSNADDLLFDLLYLAIGRGRRPIPDAASPSVPFAILVPAWREADVIAPMLARLLATVDYPAYAVFVGVYPNDAETMSAVLACGDARVRCIRVARPGPTTKADCLNQLWRGAMAHASPTGEPWAGFVLHDAEDLVPARGLRSFAGLIGRFDMVQLPVQALVDAGSRWVSGHYIDEFAEAHAKELPLRAALGVAVPSAGVGCMVSARALADVAARDGCPFAADSLTEDYQLGHRLTRLGYRTTFTRVREAAGMVATREYFPATMDAALRQKTRWLLGIALDGWDRLGWEGTAAARWMLWRDRKGLLTAALTIAGYGAMFTVIAAETLCLLLGLGPEPDGLGLADDPVLRAVLAFNLAMLGWRLGWRALSTWRSHGPVEALRSIPRALVGNAVNGLAAARAVGQYRAITAGRRPRVWEKTAHRFPVGP